jgi:thiol-disulfide isomerase/thioredoxin
MYLNNKILGIKLWVWIIVGIVIIYLLTNNKETFDNDNTYSNNDNTAYINDNTAPNDNNISNNDTSNSTIKMSKSDSVESKQKFKVFNFNTSWCGWSKRFQPEWDALVEMINTKSTDDENIRKVLRDNVSFLDVKCDNNENIVLCNKYDIPGYPHVIIENINNGEQFVYNNERTATEMYKFLVNNLYTYINENN